MASAGRGTHLGSASYGHQLGVELLGKPADFVAAGGFVNQRR